MSKVYYPIIIAAIAGKRPLEECSKHGTLAYNHFHMDFSKLLHGFVKIDTWISLSCNMNLP